MRLRRYVLQIQLNADPLAFSHYVQDSFSVREESAHLPSLFCASESYCIVAVSVVTKDLLLEEATCNTTSMMVTTPLNTDSGVQQVLHPVGTTRDRLHSLSKRTLGRGGSIHKAVALPLGESCAGKFRPGHPST